MPIIQDWFQPGGANGAGKTSTQKGNDPLGKMRSQLDEVERQLQSTPESSPSTSLAAADPRFDPVRRQRTELISKRDALASDIADIERSRAAIGKAGYGEGGVGAAFGRGVGQLQSTIGALGLATGVGDKEENLRRIVKGRAKVQANAPSLDEQTAYEEFQATDSIGGAAKSLIENPSLLFNIAAESLPSSAPSMGAAIVGGAAGGLAGGPLGAVAGGRIGASVGSGAGSFATEFGNAMLETMQKYGVDLDDPDAIERALDNDKLMDEARSRGFKRGIPVAAFDALSVGLAGKLGGGQLASRLAGEGAGALRKGGAALAGGVVETGAQGALGAAGEAGAQLATEGRISSPSDIVAEFAGELPTGAVESTVGSAVEAFKARKPAITDTIDTPDLEGAINTVKEGQRIEPEGTPALESPRAFDARSVASDDTRRVSGLNLTPTEIIERAYQNRENDPRIATVLDAPISPKTKVEQIVRLSNEGDAARAEGEFVSKVAPLVDGKKPLSGAIQAAEEFVSSIHPDVISASDRLTRLSQALEKDNEGKLIAAPRQVFNTLKTITSGYKPQTATPSTLYVRPERGGEGGVTMTQEQRADDAQRERQAVTSFKLAERRQERFEQATATGTQREDIRPGAAEPTAEIYLDPKHYGPELGGTPATVAQTEDGGVRIQYESPTEMGPNGQPVIISEVVGLDQLIGRVVRGNARMTQELAANQRKVKKGVGTEMSGPRNSVDRTSSKAVAEKQPDVDMTPRQERAEPVMEPARPEIEQKADPKKALPEPQRKITAREETATEQGQDATDRTAREDAPKAANDDTFNDAANDEQFSRRGNRVDNVRDGAPETAERDVELRADPNRPQGAADTAQETEPTTSVEEARKTVDAAIEKLRNRGQLGRVAAARIEAIMKDGRFSAREAVAAFRMADVASTVVKSSLNLDIQFFPDMTDGRGEKVQGSFQPLPLGNNGFAGVLKLSLANEWGGLFGETAAHETFHVLQRVLEKADPKTFKALNASFTDGMTIEDIHPSLVRMFKRTQHPSGMGTYWDVMNKESTFYEGFDANGELRKFSGYGPDADTLTELQAYVFGFYSDALRNGAEKKGIAAQFSKAFDLFTQFLEGVRNAVNGLGFTTTSRLFRDAATGRLSQRVGNTDISAEQAEQYSKRYGTSADSAKANLREDIKNVGGTVKDTLTVDQLADSRDIPTISLQDLVGKKLFPTIADRTAAAALYTGIDSSETNVAIPLLGGPNFPLRKSNMEAGVVWANRGKSVTSMKGNKLKDGANYMMVVLGSADMHQSNTTVSNAFFATLEAWARDGRIADEKAKTLTDMVLNSKNADPAIQKWIAQFPGFDDVAKLDDYIQKITFEARARLLEILGSKAGQAAGAPPLTRILDATREPSMAGHRWGDGVLVVELDAEQSTVKLGTDGTQRHPDYPFGIRGKVVGKLDTPVNYEVLWQDWINDQKAGKEEGQRTNVRRAFELAKPAIEVTQELVDRIGDINAPNIDSARQARLAIDFAAGNWRTSDLAKNKGGISPQEFVDAIANSSAKTVLNEYTTKDVKDAVKAGAMKLFQLGQDGKIFFALKYGNPSYAEDFGIETPGIGENEVMVTAVINNEQGARGIAAPAVMLKAIEEGATVLDAFAVPSKRFPNGFLPELYSAFGFEKVAEVPFDPQYYTEQKLADAVKYWQESSPGYNPETDGYPPLVIMKWTGTNEDRQGIVDRYLRDGIEGILEGRLREAVEGSAANLPQPAGEAAGSVGDAADAGRVGGLEGTGAGASIASRARTVVGAVANLTDQGLTNLGLTAEDRDTARAKTEQFSKRVLDEASWTPERVDNLLRQYGYASEENKSKAWVGWISPDAFTKLTASAEGRAIMERENPGLDAERLRQIGQTPFLGIDVRSTGNRANVIAHEGRHRMTALKGEGVEWVPVVFENGGKGAVLEEMTSVTLLPQSSRISTMNNGTDTTVVDLVPLTYANRDRIVEEFTGKGIQFSARRGVPYAAGNQPTPLKPAPSFTMDNLNFGGKEPGRLDYVIYNLQDKMIDTKRVQQAIAEGGKKIDENADVYLREELLHGRAAQRTDHFIKRELNPLIKDMAAKGISLDMLDKFLHARHAKERNAQIRKINPDMQDGGSGMTDAEADAYMAGLSKMRRQQLDGLAAKVDAITNETQRLLVEYGLETQETIDTWKSTYKHYVPLMREGFEEEGMSAGQGNSVRGSTAKRAMGSDLKVVDVLANIAMIRERAITRGERNRVGNALTALALQNPNDSFWFVVDPKSPDFETAKDKMIAFGIDPADAESIVGTPVQRIVDSNSGRVTYRPNNRIGAQQNVMATRINGEDRFIIFNSRNPRANRMAAAMKNLDTSNMSKLLEVGSTFTRYFASVNTQYNPVFGILNLMRDIQGAAINLSSTALSGRRMVILRNALPALWGMYTDLRRERAGKTPNSKWSRLADEFGMQGGKTGYREIFATSQDRAKAIENELTGGSKMRQVAIKVGGPVFNWLSDFNEAIENGVRIATYAEGINSGMSPAKAASVAKNLTTNFNRRGAVGAQVGALYAFFNAGVQGSARIAETLAGPAGKKIVAGGLLLGVVQAVAISAAGMDDEIPDWLKDKNVVIPTGDGKYIAFPMPLGYHAIPALSRRIVEYMMDDRKTLGGEAVGILGMLADAFNPIGNAGLSLQTIAPTVLDPLVALGENRDFSGRPIANEDFNSMDPTPGFSRNRDGASVIGDGVARAVDWLTGGNGYTPGAISPTADQIDYLIGQITGGVGREALKITATVKAAATGEDLPNYKIPLVGRFVGDANEAAAVTSRFYDGLRQMNGHDRTLKGMEEDGTDTADYLAKFPEAEMAADANAYESDVKAIKKEIKALEKEGDPEGRIPALREEMQQVMVEFNQRLEDYRK